MKIREYSFETEKLNTNLKICLISDLHSRNFKKCLNAVKSTNPHIILCAGDMLERLDGLRDRENVEGFKFLETISKIFPTYYAFGNHERFGSHMENKKRPEGAPEVTLENALKLEATDLIIVNDSYSEYISGDQKIFIGGLMPALDKPKQDPNTHFVNEFSLIYGFKILICHQPEYYDEYLKDLDLDLIVSGHTHGGQWKIFGKGIYAPNQGLFPKYSSGFYHGKLVLSAGATNTKRFVPRIFNPCEIVIININ